MDELWKVAIGLTGLSGIGAFVFLSLYKEWIVAPALSDLTKVHKFKLLRLFLILTFLFAVATLVAAAYAKQQENEPLVRSKEEFYEMQQAKYERGLKLLQEKAKDPLLSDADRQEVKKLADDYLADVEQASKALKRVDELQTTDAIPKDIQGVIAAIAKWSANNQP